MRKEIFSLQFKAILINARTESMIEFLVPTITRLYKMGYWNVWLYPVVYPTIFADYVQNGNGMNKFGRQSYMMSGREREKKCLSEGPCLRSAS